jgi:UDP-glucose 6-dehydrogenase
LTNKTRILTVILKLTANAMFAQRISSINVLSAICEAMGAHIDTHNSRVGPKFRGLWQVVFLERHPEPGV